MSFLICYSLQLHHNDLHLLCWLVWFLNFWISGEALLPVVTLPSSYLLYKVLMLVKFQSVIGFYKLVVSTSFCCVVTNETVLCLGNLCTINHDERTESYWLSSMFYYVSYHSTKLHNISKLHNSSMLYNSSEFQYYIVHKSNNIQFIVSQVLLNYLNGASLQDNSLLRYTL